jgi:L-ornithine Nalpha-acyltransferase
VTPISRSKSRGERGAPLIARFARQRHSAGFRSALAVSGSLEARLATTKKDVRRAQRLRYRVFFEEGGASPDPAARLLRRDVCRFDRVSDHLIVVDLALKERDGSPKTVGVYRLLRQEVAKRHFGFYSAGEFNVEALVRRNPAMRFLEIGRACVALSHRGRGVLELLWRGLWAYARRHGMDAMIGCASLPGADPAAHGAQIRALAQGGDPALRVEPRPGRAGPRPGAENVPAANAGALARSLPPLVKGYWRLGATFSETPAVDFCFGTTDLFVVMPLRDVEARYLHHFRVEPPPPLAA